MPLSHKPLKILKASAGSGKTHSLTAYYLNLLFSSSSNYKFREILAVTFTNKATEEMKSRILSELQKLASGDSASAFKQEILQNYPQFTEASIKEKSQGIYRQILHEYGRFSILTIDSFVQKVIRSFAFELGLEPGFKIEIQTKKVKEELVKNLEMELDHNPILYQYCLKLVFQRLDRGNPWNYQNELLGFADELFKEVYLEHQKGVSLLTEAKGQGNEFLAFEELAKTQENSFKQGIAKIGEKILFAYNSFTINVNHLRGMSTSPLYKLKSIFEPGFERNLTKKNRDQIESLLRFRNQPEIWFKNSGGGDFYTRVNPLLEELGVFYESFLGNWLLAESISKKLPFLRLLNELYHLLKIYRDKSGDLLITETQQILDGITRGNDVNTSFIWEKVGHVYQNYLLDEFQDTSVSQWQNFKPLIQESIATSPPGRRVENLLVGDIKQSIYRWRNGDWNLLYEKAEQDLRAENVLTESLEFNFRSHKNIIEFNNQLFKEAPKILQNHLNHILQESKNPDQWNWWDSNFGSLLENIYRDSYQKAPISSPDGGTVHIKIIKKAQEEGEETELDLVSEGEEGKETTKKNFLLDQSLQEINRLVNEWNYAYSDICILVRKNVEVKRALHKLLENNIPVVSGDALILGHNNAISLIISTFNYFLGPRSNAHLHLATSLILKEELENHHFPEETLIRLRPTKMGFFDHEFALDLNEAWSQWSSLPLAELFERVVRFYHLDQTETNIPYLLGFRDLLADYTREGDKGLSSFMDWWQDEGKDRGLAAGNNPNAVQITTVHKAKGLAFRAVIIPFSWPLKKGSANFWVETKGTEFEPLMKVPLPFSESLSRTVLAKDYYLELLNINLDALNELYVAFTRAKEHLFIPLPFKKNPKLVDTGDLLTTAISNFARKEEDSEGNEHFKWGYDSFSWKNPDKKDSVNADKLIFLREYTIKNKLIHKVKGKKNMSRERMGIDSKSRRGSILHEILSKVNDISRLNPILFDFKSRGLILHSEIEEIKMQVVRILQHPGLMNLFQKADKVFSERSIFTGTGSVYRPDKVLICSSETLILDYKFTLKESPSHKDQVKGYAELLSNMSYPQPRTFLFYAENYTLKEV